MKHQRKTGTKKVARRMIIHLSALLLLINVQLDAQETKIREAGIKAAVANSLYYDQSINYRTYDNIKVNPFYLHYESRTEKRIFSFDFYFLKNTLSPTVEDVFSEKDEILLHAGNAETSYLRYIPLFFDKLRLYAGASAHGAGYYAQRTFKKSFTFFSESSQLSYEITFLSINPELMLKYAFSENLTAGFDIDFPLVALNSKNYNDRINPWLQDVWIRSLDKYSGFNSQVEISKTYRSFAFDLFYKLNYFRYKEPNEKELLISNFGLGINYVW